MNTSTDDLERQTVVIYNDDLHCAIGHPLNNCQETLLVHFYNLIYNLKKTTLMILRKIYINSLGTEDQDPLYKKLQDPY